MEGYDRFTVARYIYLLIVPLGVITATLMQPGFNPILPTFSRKANAYTAPFPSNYDIGNPEGWRSLTANHLILILMYVGYCTP